MNELFANLSDRIIVVLIVAVLLGIIRMVKSRNLIAGNILQFILITLCTIFLAFIVIITLLLLLNAKFHFWF